MASGRLFGGWLDVTARLQRDKYGNDLADLPYEQYREAIRANVTAAVAEIGEYLQEADWKPWKQVEDTPQRAGARVEELIDVLHFLANLLVLEGVNDEELSRRYLEKVEFNRARQDHTVDLLAEALKENPQDFVS